MLLKTCSLISFFLILTFFEPSSETSTSNKNRTFKIDYENHQFLLDGQPFRYISGDFQYFRTYPSQWRDRMKRVRVLGLNAIQTFIPWNLHEPVQGKFDFDGIANLTEFVLLAQKYELYVLLRIGPYMCAEWDNGGLPWWLLKYKNIELRTYDPDYIGAVQNYWNMLLRVIKPLLYKNGGPILMLQIENEYGSFNHDRKYMKFLRDYVWDYLVDGPDEWYLNNGTINGALPTVDFGPAGEELVKKNFEAQRNYSRGGPYVNSEFYPGWFTMWGPANPHDIPSVADIIATMRQMWDMGASFNFYMIVGGTNFGFWSGSEDAVNFNEPHTTSYDFNAPISENGAITPKYLAIREFIKSLPNWKNKPLSVPKNNTAKNYGKVQMFRAGHSLLSSLKKVSYGCQNSSLPKTFEELDDPYGFVLYSTKLKTTGKNLSAENIADHGYVYVNDELQGFLIHDLYTYQKRSLKLTKDVKIGDILEILVENRGRQTYLTKYDPKGLHPPITLDGVALEDWTSCPINLSRSEITKLANFSLGPSPHEPQNFNLSAPGIYVGYFNASQIEDTFFHSVGWNKGQFFINGYNMGRYWPMVGPQMTLYIPKPFIRKKNVVVMIELLGASVDHIEFIDHHIFKYMNHKQGGKYDMTRNLHRRPYTMD